MFCVLQHGTCPVCRIDLNGSDTTTTEFDSNIGETIGNIGTDHQPDDGGEVDVEAEVESTHNNSNNSARVTSYTSDRNDRFMREDDIE